LKAIKPNYATESLETSFNWDEIATSIKDVEGEWYAVAFRSIRRVDADNKLLYEADAKAYNEAMLHGDDSIKATQNRLHADAKRLTNSMYETYTLE
ncbi:12257_t:CDS:2, partial [Racocetra fulgida]